MKLLACMAAAISGFETDVGSNSPSYLYCIYAGGGHNPRMLPNNMCCPFLETEGIPGIPYHSAIHGCCETRLYDLYTQECCADVGVVLDKGAKPMAPTGIMSSLEVLGGIDAFMIQWDFAESGTTFMMDVSSMTNKTTGEPVDLPKPRPLGRMETNFAMLDGMFPGVDYTFEISTINCLGEGSAYPTTHKFNY